jgi:DNA-binding Lrp family transcriptional regulator
LIADGRKTEKEIAKKLCLTEETVKKNYHQLESTGVITGATIHINYKSFGYKAVAYVSINIDPQQTDKLAEYLRKMPEVYSFNYREIIGNIDVVVILKKLQQLNLIMDTIKRNFLILQMKTAIWTDVKEMNQNLGINKLELKDALIQGHEISPKVKQHQNIIIDEIDQKIADKLAENGRMPMKDIAKELKISAVTAKRRYEKLKKNGILKVTIQTNLCKMGYKAMCVFFATTSNQKSQLIVDEIIRIPNIISIMKTSGDYDLQIYAMIQNISQLLHIQEQIGKIQGIKKIELEILRINENLKKWPSPLQYISTF